MTTHPDPHVASLARHAQQIRRQVVRLVAQRGQGYVQQGLGAAEIFTAIYFNELDIDAGYLQRPARSRCVLSTAHNSAVFHATLAECGLIDAARLDSYCHDGSQLEVNVSERLGPVVEATCGSLGQGLSVATGMALSARRRGFDGRYYVILGDGEMQEGQTWEAALCAASYGLDNLCLIVDLNRMQVEGNIDKVLRMDPIEDKWNAFGWETVSLDGHDLPALLDALAQARACRGKPFAIIANTVPGKGVSFLEGQMSHNMVLNGQSAADALSELGERA